MSDSSATERPSHGPASTAGERSALWQAVNVLGSPAGAETTPEGRAYSRAIGDALDLIEKHTADLHEAGIEAAAKLIDRKIADYVSDHGCYDPDTGFTEFSRAGEEYVSTLEELAEEIRALKNTDKGRRME